MKTISIIALLLMAALLLAQNVPDQKEKPPLPAGPIIKPLPDLAEWAIISTTPDTFKKEKSSQSATAQVGSAGAAASPAKRPRVIGIIKSGKTYREVETDTDGRKLERWWVNGTEVSLAGDGKAAIGKAASSGDFDELKWISAKNYVGVWSIGAEPCYIFQDKISVEDIGEVDVTAGIGENTQRPVYLVFGGNCQVYKFGPPPAAPLTLPDEVKKILAKRQKVVDDLTKRP
jgi:hypothetical protein